MKYCGYDNLKDRNSLQTHEISLNENKIEIDSVVYGLIQKVALNPEPIKFYSVDDLDCLVLSMTRPNPIVFFNQNDVDIELLKYIKTEPVKFSNKNDVDIELKKMTSSEPIKLYNKNNIGIVLRAFVKTSPIQFRGTVGKYVNGEKVADGLSIKVRRLRKLSDIQQEGQSLLSDWKNKTLEEFLYKEL